MESLVFGNWGETYLTHCICNLQCMPHWLFAGLVAQVESSSYVGQNGETLGDEGNEGESRGGKEALGDEGNEGGNEGGDEGNEGGNEGGDEEGNEGRSIETHEKARRPSMPSSTTNARASQDD